MAEIQQRYQQDMQVIEGKNQGPKLWVNAPDIGLSSPLPGTTSLGLIVATERGQIASKQEEIENLKNEIAQLKGHRV